MKMHIIDFGPVSVYMYREYATASLVYRVYAQDMIGETDSFKRAVKLARSWQRLIARYGDNAFYR